jgi:fructokinase
LLVIEPHGCLALALIRTMAGITAIGKNRSDIPREVDGCQQDKGYLYHSANSISNILAVSRLRLLDPLSIQIAGIGEALFDVYPEREVLGGAPLNFAVHANRLASRIGMRAAPVSRVGWDARGERIKSRLASFGVSTEYLQADIDHSTGTAEVLLDLEGHASYRITPECAWDFLEFSEELEELAANCKVVCFGTLAQRRDGARETIEAFVAAAKDAIRLFDVNLRQNFYDLSMLRRGCALASDLKLNESELEVLAELFGLQGEVPAHYVRELFERFPLERVLLTRGSRGCMLFTANNEQHEGGQVLYPAAADADSVGAGDAAAAGFVTAILAGAPDAQAVELANHMGAWVASQPGATPELPGQLVDRVLVKEKA